MMLINKNPEYFLTVAEVRSISKAAEKLFVSQPYLSRHIIRLEEELHVKLLNREKVPLQLTPAGEIYANYLESSKQMYHKLEKDLEAVSDLRKRTLRIGFSNWRASTLLPEILPDFVAAYPEVGLELVEVPNSQLYGLIAEEKVDFAIMNTMMDAPDYVVSETIMYERILLVGNRNDPMAAALDERRKAGKPLDLHFLEDARVILLNPDTALATRVNNYLDSQRIVLKNIVYSMNATTALGLTAHNFGFCFLNETGVHAAPSPEELLFFDLQSDDLAYPLCVIYKKKSYLTPIVQELIKTMVDFYKTHYNEAFYLS